MKEQMQQVEKLPKAIKAIWRLQEFILFGVLLLIAVGLEVTHFLTKGVVSQWLQGFSVGLFILSVLVLIFGLILILYRWNFWTYFIDDRQVELHNGYFFRKQIIIPIARVQNVTLKQGPILRWKNLQKVIIVTAAGGDQIDGLEVAQAKELKELIMALAREAKNDI